MIARVRLVARRLVMRVPLAELPHALCPLLRPACPCMQGWEARDG